MDLTIHETYAFEELILAYGGLGAAESLCDGQFLVFAKDVLCLATVGVWESAPHFSSPSDFHWKSAGFAYDPKDPYAFLPPQVRDVWGPDRTKLKRHQIFVRTALDERFFYAGEAHLGGYGGNDAGFMLAQKLPRDAWLRLGGYPGWRIEVNDERHYIDNHDVATFEGLVRVLDDRDYSHLHLTRYEEDELSLFTNASRGWLMYQQYPSHEGLYVESNDNMAEELVQFHCACGIDLEFPMNRTLSRDVAIQAVREFFVTGLLPTCVRWGPTE